MDGDIARLGISSLRGLPGAAFGEVPLPARKLDPGMGVAVARRTVFRPEDQECFGRVADRVAQGNIALLGSADARTRQEQARLRNAIATGTLLTSGRHLQHGDADQPTRNMEVFTNCATAAASFAKFYLLLNGSGVGRSYDDSLMAVDWAQAPTLLLYLSPDHPDHPAPRPVALCRRTRPAGRSRGGPARSWRANCWPTWPLLLRMPSHCRIADSREGWAKAVELLEAMAFRGERERTLVLDFSDDPPRRHANSRHAGTAGVRAGVAAASLPQHTQACHRAGATGLPMERWEQALRLDHYLSMEVQVGGARRAARMATKSWRDPGVLRFIRIKEAGGLWTANNSVMVDADFWARVRGGDPADPLTRHAVAVFQEATRCAWVNGEPGFINGDRLEDHRTGMARARPVDHDGRSFRSARYQVDAAAPLLAELTRRAAKSDFPATTNPCGEITLHVTGGYCVIADFAPVLACPVPLEDVVPGAPPPAVAALWDARVEDAVRLGVRFLMRANRMDSLYAARGGAHQSHGHRANRAARVCVAAFRPGLRRLA